MVSSGMFRRVALVKTDFSEERSASFIRVTRIGELGTMLAVTSNRRTLPCGDHRKYCGWSIPRVDEEMHHQGCYAVWLM
jgi:hypothetical protein